MKKTIIFTAILLLAGSAMLCGQEPAVQPPLPVADTLPVDTLSVAAPSGSNDADVDKVTVDNLYDIDLTKIELPPVSVFLEAAKDYADVKYFDSRIEEETNLMKQTRRDWLKYFSIQGNYQYGTNNNYLTQSGNLIPPGYIVSSANTQSFYNIGVAVSIPFDDLFSRKQKTGAVRARVTQAEYEAERALENRQLTILQAYNEVIKHLSILKVKAEAIALYDAQMKISENDFVNGRIDIIDLSLERSRRSDAMVKYQESRAALHNAVTLLEMLTKIRIIRQ